MAPSSDSISSLVQEAYDEPVPAKFTAFMDFNRDTLSDLISRHVRVLQRRKPDLEDHQLTIYDKALLHLTRNGNDLTFSPAVLLFCQEYLGIDEEDINETRTLLDQYTMLPTPIDQGELSCSLRGHSLTVVSLDGCWIPARLLRQDRAERSRCLPFRLSPDGSCIPETHGRLRASPLGVPQSCRSQRL